MISKTVSPNGIVTSTPAMSISAKGDNVTLECITEAGPGNQFVWLGRIRDVLCQTTDCADTGVYTFDLNEDGKQLLYYFLIN